MREGNKRIIAITGPTATGKSRAALAVSRDLQSRGYRPYIISADSVQVYRYMDIGTDKLPPEQRGDVPHYLIDVVDPDEEFNAEDFRRHADRLIAESGEDGIPIVAGGTGFYLRSLLWGLFEGPGRDEELRNQLHREMENKGVESLHQRLASIDPEAAGRVHPHDHVRIVRALEVYELTGKPITGHFREQQTSGPRYHALLVGLALEREKMYEKINRRVGKMVEEGLVEEVERLRQMGYGPELKSQQSLGYKHMHMYLDGKIGLEEAMDLVRRYTRHFARRQLTWLRKEKGLLWVPAEDRDEILKLSIRHVMEAA
ncbi:MAG: tRNA (adenosine(37)-N6)-dimethylallyltransferase MiaA [bacterium]